MTDKTVKLSPDSLNDDQREYIRLVQLGQNKEDIFAVVRKLAPHLEGFRQLDVALGLNYLMNDILEGAPKSEYLDRLREDIAKVGTALYYIKGTSIDRKEKGLDNNIKGE